MPSKTLNPLTQAQFKRLGIDPGRVTRDGISAAGYELIQMDADGKRRLDHSGGMIVAKHEWPTREDWMLVRAAMVGDGLKWSGEDETIAEDPGLYPVDRAILLRRQIFSDPTTQRIVDLKNLRDSFSAAQLDEYETRYAKMYGEDDVHKQGDDAL